MNLLVSRIAYDGSGFEMHVYTNEFETISHPRRHSPSTMILLVSHCSTIFHGSANDHMLIQHDPVLKETARKSPIVNLLNES